MSASPLSVTDLDRVIGDAPAAVLLVDLDAGTVVHANEVAVQLAPAVRLPVRLDEWSRVAELRDPHGEPLAETDHPLSRLLRSEAVPGQPVSARRRSEMGGAREPLWVVGVPMTGAPMLEQHALVVFLAVREQDATAAVDAMAQEAHLRERAVLATGLSFTVADARDPELPLVWVNPAFTATTGYEFEEVVGANCRFLQGPGTDRLEVARIRQAVRDRTGVVSTILNYRKDGLAFWNQITITPVVDAAGEVTHFVGVQSDVSGRIESDRQRDRALRAEHEARLEAERAQARLSVLAEVSAVLTGEVEEAAARERLLESLVPRYCDVALLLHDAADAPVVDYLTRHRDEHSASVADEVALALGAHGTGDGPTVPPGEEGPFRLLDVASAEMVVETDDPLLGAAAALRMGSLLSVAVPGPVDGDVLVLGRDPEAPAFTPDDGRMVADLAGRVGLILDNLRMHANQSRIARTLQRSLLPSVPELEGVEVEARYLPAARDAEVGGDFYEVFQHADRSIGVAVGDVEGHDIYAAAAMGQLRGLLRATALSQRLMPAATLEHVDWLLLGAPSGPRHSPSRPPAGGATTVLPGRRPSPRLASMVFVHLEPPPPPVFGVSPGGPVGESADSIGRQQVGDWPRQEPTDDVGSEPPADSPYGWGHTRGSAWTLTLASAGHLPPLVRLPEGRLVFLDPPHARGPLLGVGAAPRRHDGTFALPSGSVLLLYTDGLVERPGEAIDDGLGRLLTAAAEAPDVPTDFVDHILHVLLPQDSVRVRERVDDVVVVALRLLGPGGAAA